MESCRPLLFSAAFLALLAGCTTSPDTNPDTCNAQQCQAQNGQCINGQCITNAASSSSGSVSSSAVIAGSSSATSGAVSEEESSSAAPPSSAGVSSSQAASSASQPASSASSAGVSSSAEASSSAVLPSSSVGCVLYGYAPDAGVEEAAFHRIYFGTRQGTFDIDPLLRNAGMSPDGRRLVAAPETSSADLTEYHRPTVADRFQAAPRETAINESWSRYPRLTNDATGLHLTSNGSGNSAGVMTFRTRSTADGGFPAIKQSDLDLGIPLGTAEHWAATPTADGTILAFASNRISDTNAAVHPTSLATLWTATSANGNPADGYTNLQSHPLASPPRQAIPYYPTADIPQWLSDDGLTLIFRSERNDPWVMLFASENVETGDMFMTTRQSRDVPFECAVPIPQLSVLKWDEESLAMPSWETLVQNGGGEAYLRRHGPRPNRSADGPYAWFRVPICLDQPCVETPAECRVQAPRDGGVEDSGTYPCGTRELYFSSPLPAALDADFSHGALTAQNNLLAGTVLGTQYAAYTVTNGTLSANHSAPLGLDYSSFPHVTADLLGLYSCDPDARSCTFRRRAATNQAFGTVTPPGTEFIGVPPWGFPRGAGFDTFGGLQAVVPSANGEWIAFAADWLVATCSGSARLRTTSGLDLWSARAIDPLDPSLGFTDYMRHPRALSSVDDVPQWLSDDGLTLIFTAGNATARAFYQSTRNATDEDFGPREPLSGFFGAQDRADSFTIPSLAYLEANGCEGDGYASREVTAGTTYDWYTFQVCVGLPCP